MLSFNNSDIVFLAALCVSNVVSASVVHRAVLLNSGFMQRRIFFEGLSLFGILAAIALSLFSVLIWVRNPAFVIACTAVWVTLCMLTVVRIWRDHRKRLSKKALEIPDFPMYDTAGSDETTMTSHLSQPALSGNNEVRDKLKNYNKKRACKSASISNLSAYRQRSKKDFTRPSDKWACK